MYVALQHGALIANYGWSRRTSIAAATAFPCSTPRPARWRRCRRP
jgi:hypothetical protein